MYNVGDLYLLLACLLWLRLSVRGQEKPPSGVYYFNLICPTLHLLLLSGDSGVEMTTLVQLFSLRTIDTSLRKCSCVLCMHCAVFGRTTLINVHSDE